MDPLKTRGAAAQSSGLAQGEQQWQQDLRTEAAAAAQEVGSAGPALQPDRRSRGRESRRCVGQCAPVWVIPQQKCEQNPGVTTLTTHCEGPGVVLHQ